MILNVPFITDELTLKATTPCFIVWIKQRVWKMYLQNNRNEFLSAYSDLSTISKCV